MGISAVLIGGKWYVRMSWEGHRRLFRAGETQEEAEQIANDFEVMVRIEGEEKALERYGRKKKVRETVKSYAEKHKVRMEKMDLKPSTILRYSQGLDNIVDEFGNLPINGITRRILKDYYGRLVDKGLKRDSIRNINAALSSMLTEALDDELIEANPALRVGKFYKKAPKKMDRPDPFSAAEASTALLGIRKKFPEYYELFLTMYLTGMRPGEATVLKVEDLDWQRDVILVQRNLPSNPAITQIVTPKSKASQREVELDPELRSALEFMLKRRREDWMAKGRPEPEWLFCDDKGQYHDSSLYRKRWWRVLKAVGVRYRPPGQMRHTFASLNLSRGKPLLWVAAQLGHKDPNLTLRVYSKWMPKENGEKERSKSQEGENG